MAKKPDPVAIVRLSNKVRPVVFPLLAGRPPAVQAGVLADLVATWLAGHCFPGDLDKTRALRMTLLGDFLEAVELLTNVNAALLGTPHDPIEVENAYHRRQ